jgi:hypothetical protein
MTVRRYILQNQDEAKKKVTEGNGYYQDVKTLRNEDGILAIGTTNYNTFIDDVTGMKATHLNGSVNDYYDPYKNKIISISKEEAETSGRIYVPFLFTQSGIKPLTSVSMSRRYVEIFDGFSNCNVIGVIGFGFNSDDGHINGLFRELIEDKKKKVVVFHYANGFQTNNLKATYEERLRIQATDRLVVKEISKDRKVGGTFWLDVLLNEEEI